MPQHRRPLLAAKWKQNHLWQDIEEYCDQLREGLPAYFAEAEEPALDLLICPPLCYLGLIGALLEDSHILSGSQLLSTTDSGAFTGEVSARMVADLGCDYAIIGHSERRSLFAETEEQISLRLVQAMENDLVPVLCVGEDLETRQTGRAASHVQRQLDAQREQISQGGPGDIVVAYEPIWAIGTGENASAADAQEMAALIRKWFADQISGDCSAAVQILYGGSVKPANITEYFSQQDIDGALIGGASLDAFSMMEMLRACQKQLAA